MEIRVHGPGQEPAAAGGHHAHARERLRARGRLLPHRGDPRAQPTISTPSPYCLAGEGEQEYNVVTVKLRQPGRPRRGHERALRGQRELRALRQDHARRGRAALRARGRRARSSARSVRRRRCPTRLRAAQTVFDAHRWAPRRGAVHARRRPGGAARRRRPAQRARQAHRPRPARAAAAAGRRRPAWCRDGSASRSSRRPRWPGSRSSARCRRRRAWRSTRRAASARRSSGSVRGERANVYTHPERIDLDR